MGCFFGCFRVRDDHRPPTHLVSESLPYNAREPVVSRNRNPLSSLLLSEENDCSPCKDKETHVLGTPQPDIDVAELKDEAKFLKACGTLPKTPAEIRKASERFKDSAPHDGDSESLKFHSWLPNTSIQKLNLDNEPDQPPTPIKLGEEWVKGSGYSEHTPRISCGDSGTGSSTTTQVHSNQTHKSTASSVSPSHMVASMERRYKSVRFDCEPEFASQNSKQTESASNHSVSKPSPFPTPLKLTDEFQTPGTVFPSYLENLEIGKNPRIRSQYVYSVMNPVENFSQLKMLKEEDPNSNQLSDHLRESLEQADEASPKSEVGTRENSVEEVLKVEASLSSWVKPLPTNLNDNTQSFGPVPNANACSDRTLRDRPIIGMVAAHWSEAESSRISPKWWDGNGIPNSTTKYKEDQKVSWHATPFEERLEKALSVESSFSQRKHISGTPPIENEECDTAVSQLQSSSHFNSLVSF